MKSFQAVPAGDYRSKLISTEEKPNSAKTGSYVQFNWEITKGDCKGSKWWGRLNLDNPSEKAVEIAEDEYVTICEALGFAKPEWDTAKLHGKECIATLSVQPASDKGSESNVARGYAPIGGSKSSGGSKKPWEEDEPEPDSDGGKKDKKKKDKKKSKEASPEPEPEKAKGKDKKKKKKKKK